MAGVAMAGIVMLVLISLHAWRGDGFLRPRPSASLAGRHSMQSPSTHVPVPGSLTALTEMLSASPQVGPLQWKAAGGGNGHWYGGYVGANPSWSVARAAALRLGGDLVSLATREESEWVYANIASIPSMWNLRMGPWIGLRRPDRSSNPRGDWIWCDGQPMTWSNWGPDHPYDGIGGSLECDHAKYLSWPPKPMDQWGSDTDSHQPAIHWEGNRSWIIEWSSDCDSDGQVDYGQIRAGELVDADGNGVPDRCEQQ